MLHIIKSYTLIPLFFYVLYLIPSSPAQTISFPAPDGLEITADLYELNPSAPILLLCHQANFSRGEYQETAKKFNKMGFTCLAIDQRSGKEVHGVSNQTAARAKKKGLPTTYLDAEQDIIAGVNFLVKKYKRDVILIGSSYSASLVLKIAKEHDKVSAVIAFSPGEYFKNKLNLTQTISGLTKPAFITSSRNEAIRTKSLLRGVRGATQFVPGDDGRHGSKALWAGYEGSGAYWEALEGFLAELK